MTEADVAAPRPKVPSEGIDTDSLGFLINDVARLMRCTFAAEIDRGAIGVTAAEARVLAHMARSGAARQNVLAQRLGMQPMSLTGFLDRLESAGLIRRGTDPQDRRAKIVTLTDNARSLLEQIAEAGRRARDTACAGLSGTERETFRALALRVRANLEPIRAEAATPELRS